MNTKPVIHKNSQRPYTIYCPALLYRHDGVLTERLFSQPFQVSGDNPLSTEEVVSRARKMVEVDENWLPPIKPLSEWTFQFASVSYVACT